MSREMGPEERLPQPGDQDFIIGGIRVSRRLVFAMLLAIGIGGAIDYVINRFTGQAAQNENGISPEELVRGELVGLLDEQGKILDWRKPIPGSRFIALVSEQVTPGGRIVDVESTARFNRDVDDNTDNPGGWPITGHHDKPVHIFGNKQIFAFAINMDNLNGNEANRIPNGFPFELSMNVTTELNKALKRKDGEPGPIPLTRA